MEPLPSDMQRRAQKNAQASDSGLGFFPGFLLDSELFCLALLASPSALAVLVGSESAISTLACHL